MTLTGLIINGQEVAGVQGFSYKAVADAHYYYHDSVKPNMLKQDRLRFEGVLTLEGAGFEELEGMGPATEGIMGLRAFECLATYEDSQGQMRYDVLEGCYFKEVGKDLNKQETVALPFVARNIRYGLSL